MRVAPHHLLALPLGLLALFFGAADGELPGPYPRSFEDDDRTFREQFPYGGQVGKKQRSLLFRAARRVSPKENQRWFSEGTRGEYGAEVRVG